MPLSHPFVERLIGTLRREFLDHVSFWTARDLERKLALFKEYYNRERTHDSLGGLTPAATDTLVTARVLVYAWCMARTNVDIDEKACALVMRRYRLKTKREAINFALRALAAEPLNLDSARKLRGSGWTGDLDAIRTDRVT